MRPRRTRNGSGERARRAWSGSSCALPGGGFAPRPGHGLANRRERAYGRTIVALPASQARDAREKCDLLPLADGRSRVPISLAVRELDPPRRAVADMPEDVSDVLLRISRPRDAAGPRADATEPQPCRAPSQEAYFEIYFAERVNLTSILFSGGDWRWRFCSAAGTPIAASAGYASESACAAAVATLRGSAGTARVRVAHHC